MSAIVCRYCGAEIVCDPEVRTPASAWSAPADDDPTRCIPEVPGHAPLSYPGPIDGYSRGVS